MFSGETPRQALDRDGSGGTRASIVNPANSGHLERGARETPVAVFPLPAASVGARAGADEASAPCAAARGVLPTIHPVTTLEGMRALEADWTRLEQRAAAPSQFFQTFAWNMAWAERFVQGKHAPRLHILTGWRSGELVAVFPLMIACDGPFCTLKWLTDPFLQYGDALLSADLDRERWLAAAWAHIIALPGIDTIQLRKVRADAAAHALLANFCARTDEDRVGCFLALDGAENYEALVARLPSRRRQLRRKLRRALEQDAALTFTLHEQGEDMSAAIAETLRLKRQWLAETGLPNKVIPDPRLDGFLTSLAARNLDGPRAVACELLRDGVATAYEIAFQFKGHHYLYIIAQPPALAALSPSKVEIDAAQAWCVDNGFHTFDLLPPSDRYKRDLSDQTIAIADFVLATTLKGRLYLAYLARIRPALKRLYMRLGEGPRHMLGRLMAGLRG